MSSILTTLSPPSEGQAAPDEAYLIRAAEGGGQRDFLGFTPIRLQYYGLFLNRASLLRKKNESVYFLSLFGFARAKNPGTLAGAWGCQKKGMGIYMTKHEQTKMETSVEKTFSCGIQR